MNNAAFLRSVHQRLISEGVNNYVFGGWAEEFHNIREPGLHSDIDLLVKADDFEVVDDLIKSASDFYEIIEKRFTHKRAFEFNSIRIELFIVSPKSLTTNFFSGSYIFRWPCDTFVDKLGVKGLQICSKHALVAYRQAHKKIVSLRSKLDHS
ncbi:hypothetical protein KCM76_20355 [Zooshikella marina]|uniref:hypothetical protein n=1 Tax=Zooshikella ganghwensis TaxID=202772 RepID=UPI001BAE904B|nr:hypothetical protein [Zooshikella ganghwensis]MBU2708356.1 hypothetical protein [Zooshikella ganghwensis]